KQAARDQLIADTAQQVSALGVMVTKLFEAYAGVPYVGLALAAASAVAAFGIIASFKARSRALAADRLFTGGPVTPYLTGRSDKNGGRGHRVEDSNLVIGGDEFVVNG